MNILNPYCKTLYSLQVSRWIQIGLGTISMAVMLLCLAYGLRLEFQTVSIYGGFSGLSINELCIFAFATLIAMLVSGIFVARSPTGLSVGLRIIGAPFMAGFVFYCLVFICGVASGLLSGKNITLVVGESFAAGLIFGFGGAIFAIPGAILGGVLGACVRRHFLRASNRPTQKT